MCTERCSMCTERCHLQPQVRSKCTEKQLVAGTTCTDSGARAQSCRNNNVHRVATCSCRKGVQTTATCSCSCDLHRGSACSCSYTVHSVAACLRLPPGAAVSAPSGACALRCSLQLQSRPAQRLQHVDRVASCGCRYDRTHTELEHVHRALQHVHRALPPAATGTK